MVPGQTGFSEAVMLTPTFTMGSTVIVTGFETATVGEEQGRLDVRLQVITSPVNGTYAKVDRLLPVGNPFTFHWYSGLPPPFTGVAV
jgi:hypothetical protein